MKYHIFQTVCIVAILVSLPLSPARALSTRDKVLDEITVSQSDQYQVINISFNFRVQYLRHYPKDFGKEVRLQLEPILTSRDEQEGLQSRESLFPPAGNAAGLVRIEYEGDDFAQPTVTVIFDKPTFFEARQGKDFRSLVVLVPLKKEKEMPAAKDATESVSEKVPTADKEQTSKAPSPSSPPAGPGVLTPDRQKNFLQEGEEVMTSKNYQRAIQIYTKLLDSKDQEVVELAQFQLALAREYNGHLAHAKAEYRNYLTEYPEGENRDEAEKRLKGLMAGRPFSVSDPLSPAENLWQTEFYGSISQFFDWDQSFARDAEDDESDDTVNISALSTSFDATWRLRNEHYQLETVFIGRQEFDLLDERDHETRISRLYIDFEDSDQTLTTRWGRQTANSGGVLGRFDGGHFSYLLGEKVRLNLVAGFPVSRSSDGLDSEKYFYGINFDFGRFADHWDFNTYIIDQKADGLADRRAIGGEARFVGDRGSFFTLLDYDILFKSVNIALFSGNWLMPNDKTRLNFSADYRNSPMLSTSNGLIGQFSPSLEALEDAIGETALRKLAEDRTLGSSYVTLGASHPLSENIQIAGEVSWSQLDGAPASGGVEAFEATGDEFFYSLQLFASNLLKQGDISSLSLRYGDTKLRDTYTLNLSSRYPINDAWRINPRMQIDYRVNKERSGDQWRYRPSLRLEYLLAKGWRFELEGGVSYANQELPGIAEDTLGYYTMIGLRWDF